MGRCEQFQSAGRSTPETTAGDGSRPAQGDERRRILNAMVETVAQRGYQDTDIAEVIERAGVPAAVFSRLFASKEDCFVETIHDSVATVERAVEASWTPDTSWPDRVRLGLHAFVGALMIDPARTRLAMVDAGAAGPAAAQEMRRAYERFVPYFDEGREQASHELPARTSDAVVGGIALTVRHQVADGNIPELPNLLPDLVYFALVPYLGHRRASALAVA